MDYASSVLPYEALQSPVSEEAIAFQIGTRPRDGFWHPSVAHSPRQNQIIAALPDADYKRLQPHLEFMQLPFGSALYEAGCDLNYAYFPTDGIVAPLCVMTDGAATAIAITGKLNASAQPSAVSEARAMAVRGGRR